MSFDRIPALDGILKADLIVLIDSAMALSSFDYFFHVFAIAVHIDNCEPCVDSNHKDIYFLS